MALGARYAYAPRVLGYCGRSDARALHNGSAADVGAWPGTDCPAAPTSSRSASWTAAASPGAGEVTTVVPRRSTVGGRCPMLRSSAPACGAPRWTTVAS
ncbi:DUF6390 family protein [Nocardia canadensis]|uniref:DUF6390 family protein n=1 Tax=Nocardia canadensis TaxID=3065238 RepID=UPI002931C26F|nr:DUF6390 family protein [Nocardia canadensis]